VEDFRASHPGGTYNDYKLWMTQQQMSAQKGISLALQAGMQAEGGPPGSEQGKDAAELKRKAKKQDTEYSDTRAETAPSPAGQTSVPEEDPLQTVPTPPLLWWGVRATLPCKPRLNEEPRCENEKASLRTLHIRT
jgi:hypothetical protein